MYLTEEEAKKKECPFGPLNILASVQCGEIPAVWPDFTKCGASTCMAWRRSGNGRAVYRDGVPVKYDDAGFCGLAGRPE